MNSELEKLIKFHGHLGPFVVLGYKMGLFALELLKCDLYWDLKVTAHFGFKPPPSCTLDGLQIATGCTLGKGNIIRGKNNLGKAVFEYKGEICEISVKQKILNQFPGRKDDLEGFATEIFETIPEKLFNFKMFSK